MRILINLRKSIPLAKDENATPIKFQWQLSWHATLIKRKIKDKRQNNHLPTSSPPARGHKSQLAQ